MTEEVHLPPQAGSPPWRRSFALDLATRDGGDASGVFRRAEAYLAWLAGEGGGESEALGHPGATQSPDGSPRAAEGLRGAESAVSDAEAAEWGALADAATEGPWRVSGRRVLGEGYGAEFVGIPDTAADAAFVAKSRWIVSRLLDDRERLTGEASRVPVLLADKAALMGDVDRLTAERDGARGMRVIATRAFETTRRVLQEATRTAATRWC